MSGDGSIRPTVSSAWEEDHKPLRHLYVTIKGANNLRNDRGMPANDPYCICQAGKGPPQECRTHRGTPTADTLNPVWDCELMLKNYQRGDDIRFVVYDDLGGSSEKEELGSATLGADLATSQFQFEGELKL